MSFQSYTFLFALLPVSVAGWWLLNWRGHGRLAQGFLLVVSLAFYGKGNLAFLPLLLGSILFNFLVGKAMGALPRARKPLLVLGLLGNLGLLGYFKYANFFLDNLNWLLGTSIGALSLLLPLGISFFTFQQIAFLVDRYRGDPADYTLLEYACFVSFFPCVTSGPIAFHDEVIPQMRAVQGKGPSAQGIAEGLWLFSLGIWKKVIVAEAFGGGADWGWANLPALNSTTALAVTLSYTLQLYFDFSGYTDMARGIGKMLGVTLPENFDVPYQALTIRGFWKGWHMTMTRFFTRYLYIPLGGSRRGVPRTCVNTLVIFLASGLWHGADWSFVVWGGLHGIAMVADRLLGSRLDRLHPALSWALTFGYVNFCWIFFRAGQRPGGAGHVPGHCAVCVRSAGRRVYHLLSDAGDYLDWTLPGDRYGPFGPAHVSALCGGEYVLLSARDASGPEKASDDRAARCAGGDSAVLGGDLSNGREPVYLF